MSVVEKLEEAFKNIVYVECPDCCAKIRKKALDTYEGKCCDCGRDLSNEKPSWLKVTEVLDEFVAFKKDVEDRVISLGQLRAGNIGRIWDAGQTYALLRLLGKAPTFKTRKEAFDWAEKNICCFLTSKESKEKLLGEKTK